MFITDNVLAAVLDSAFEVPKLLNVEVVIWLSTDDVAYAILEVGSEV